MNEVNLQSMKTNYKISVWLGLIILLFSLGCRSVNAEDLRKIVNLSGYWKFSIGDDKSWAATNYNDADWDQIRVPGSWESAGYRDYNGYAWYRTGFKIYDVSYNGPIYLVLGYIDDVDEVYLNGKRLAGSGSFPPNLETAYNRLRKYTVPRDWLNTNGNNTIAVRVYDYYLDGGITSGKPGIYVDEDIEFLDVMDLSGKWKFHPGDNKQWTNPSFDDETWKQVDVPADWEWEGYENYDGYGWYRKEFRMPSVTNGEKLYLSLGKIDDYDYVYLNGKLIGTVFDLPKDHEYRFKGYEYNARRVYPIPSGLLRKDGVNVISVRVYDQGQRGGIYEGPIGIMTESSYKKYRHKHYESQSFWDYIIDEFIID